MILKNLCIIVLWTNVALALEGLKGLLMNLKEVEWGLRGSSICVRGMIAPNKIEISHFNSLKCNKSFE